MARNLKAHFASNNYDFLKGLPWLPLCGMTRYNPKKLKLVFQYDAVTCAGCRAKLKEQGLLK